MIGFWTQELRFISLHTEKSYRIMLQVILVMCLADGSALDFVSMGDVRILLPNGSVWLLEKVRHIPDLKRNLISDRKSVV